MKGAGTIGIVGGGQLGRMLTLAAIPLGFKVIVIDPTPGSPAAQAGAEEITADFFNEPALHALAKNTDYITFESEHVNAEVLQQLESDGKQINPSPKTLLMIQDKLAQKRFLRDAGIPVADFIEVNNPGGAEKVLTDFGGRMVLKTRKGGFDGRGNVQVKSAEELAAALEQFKDTPIYSERIMPFQKELAVMVARDMAGRTLAYPVVETIQERGICTEVLAPAPVDPAVHEQAEKVALQVAGQLQGSGVFGIEMFLSSDGQILVNEIAPRVHNSGHYTQDANRTSQFEQHVRAITGLPLGATDLIAPAAVMVNILSERDGETELKGLELALTDPNTSVHLYGKSPTKIDRKMGHITSTGRTVEEARIKANEARRALSI